MTPSYLELYLSDHSDLTVHLMDETGQELTAPDYEPQQLDFAQAAGNVHFACASHWLIAAVEIRNQDREVVWSGAIDPQPVTSGTCVTLPLGRVTAEGGVDL